MKILFYPKLALTGIRKNRKLYFPYILSCIGIVMMAYILQSLSYSPLLHEMEKGGNSVEEILSLGKFVIIIFAVIFLFYTNSFLMRRRYKEFGLYSILGMNRRSISCIVLWESIIVSVISLFLGTGLGILFSKMAELGLLNAIHQKIDYQFTVAPEAVRLTMGVFCGIFALLMVKSVIRVLISRPLELLRSENVGERPPKANWIFALLGLLFLGTAYVMAVTIESPLSALTLFFVAVILVIVATYILFISGSVALCRILQKNKGYYYQTHHFVTVSSMAYRMKRNGAGLASICILVTMVLVMISSTASLYFGMNDTLRTRFPRNTEIALEVNHLENLTDDKIEVVKKSYQKVFAKHRFTPENSMEYRYVSFTGALEGTKCSLDDSEEDSVDLDDIYMLYFVSVSDYNRIMGTNYTLSEGEAYLYPYRCDYTADKIEIDKLQFNMKGRLSEFMKISESNIIIMPSLMFVIPDYEALRPLEKIKDNNGEAMLYHRYYYGYDYEGVVDDKEAIEIYEDQMNALEKVAFIQPDKGIATNGGCVAKEKDDFFSTFGGLFFLGIMLSILFILAAAVIIYYKQISEGYEDKERFNILLKIGMTKKDIKKSINSGVLTVFFAPLLCAGMHLAFAFPFIWKLLQLFSFRNLSFVIGVTIVAFCILGICYGLLYKMTARAYYSIVTAEEAK